MRRLAVSTNLPARAAMGLTAFALLMAAECVLAVLTGQAPTAYLRAMMTAAGRIGLAGQIVFALFPLLQRTTTLRGGA
ncbi:MAG: hypothetical protein ACJ8AI_14800 [Rhodopila sp.]